MKRTTFLRISLGLFLIAVLLVPLSSAISGDSGNLNSQNYLAKDDPQIIASLKSHIVYIGESQQARMNGVIRYADSISNGTGVDDLQWIQEDYLMAASSIPLMYTSDQINAARSEMQDQSIRFADQTANQLVFFNGNVDSMRSFINDSMLGFNDSFNDPNHTQWLTTARARLTVFNESANDRNATLSLLKGQGVDVTRAEKISDEINAEHTELMSVLMHKGDITIEQVNSKIRILNQNFRNVIREYRVNMQVQAQFAAVRAIKE
jgi:hypothetical protein